MNELLVLCGYEAQEMENELPRVQKAFAKLGITEEDILRGKQRLTTYYDIELAGVRKLLGVFVKELVNMTLAREEGAKTIIHACMAAGFEILGSALVSQRRDIYVEVPNPLFMVVFGGIFDQFVQILEAAEGQWLKSGVVAHCGMVKSRVGLLALNLIPKPDLMVTSGLMCDTSPKVNDLIQEIYGIPACYYDTCHDREAWEYPDATRIIAFAAQGLRKVAERLEGETGFEIEDHMLWEVLRAKDSYGEAVGRVRNLIRNSDPVPLGSTHENLMLWLNPVAFTLENLKSATDAVNILHEELQERVRKGAGVTEKGAPRVLGILPPHHADPRLEHLANAMGLAIVAADYELSAPASPSSERDREDPYVAASQHLRGSMVQPLASRVALILDACKRFHIDGVLDHFHVGCRTVAGDAFIIRDAVMKELGLPVLLLEWENFDPRVFDLDRYSTKLELFKSMMQDRKQ